MKPSAAGSDTRGSIISRFCWPALLPWALLGGEAAWGWASFNYTERVLNAHFSNVQLLAKAFTASALLLCLWGKARRWAWDHLESHGGAWKPGPWLAAAGVFAYFAHLFLVRYNAYSILIPMDTADQLALVWGMVRGQGTYNPLVGVNALSIHFSLSQAFYAPLLLIVSRPWALFAAQSFLLASMGMCAFLYSRRLTGSNAAAWAGMLVVCASPGMVHLLRSGFLIQLAMAPIFLWAMHAHDSGRRWAALALWAVLLGCSEQATLTLAGFSLFIGASSFQAKDRRGALHALGLLALAASLFWVEMRIKAMMSPHQLHEGHYADIYYGHLTAGGAYLKNALGTLSSPAAYLPMALLFLDLALLPLAAGRRLLVLACAALPQILANPVTEFHNLVNLQMTYVYGPAAWCALEGMAALWRSEFFKKRRYWLLPWVLLSLGQMLWWVPIGFFDIPWPPYARTMAAAVAMIPSGASVWADDAAGPALAFTERIKLVNSGAINERFTRGIFLPEYFLLRKNWVVMPDREEVLSLLAKEGYRKILDADAIMVLKHPQAPFGAPPPPLTLPRADDSAAGFRDYLLSPADFPQDALKRYYRSRKGWPAWADFAQKIGVELPSGAILLHSGRFFPLPPLLTVFGNAEHIPLGERLDTTGSGRGLGVLNAAFEQYRSAGVPLYTLSETFGQESMGFLEKRCRFTKPQAESLVAAYRPVRVARLADPLGERQALILMWPKDAAQARRLEEKLRKTGFRSHADLALK